MTVAGATPKLSTQKVTDLLGEYFEKTKLEASTKVFPKKAIGPIKMKMDPISPNGKVGIKFNQKVAVPFNFIENQGKTSRLLKEGDEPISLSQIDTKDIFTIFFLLKSAED